MHAILVSLGTDGDVIPYIGLGTRLRARGHRVSLVAPEQYGAAAARLGFDFRLLISDAEMHGLLADPDFWHPLKSALVGVRMGVGLIPRQYALLAELAGARDAVLVANPGVFAARLVQEKLGRPMATLLLQPWMIPSTAAPPVMPGGLTLPRGVPLALSRLYWQFINVTGDLLVGRHVNRARAALGMGPVRRLFEWWLSPQRVIGMFPDWYGPPQADWPPQVRLAGFPLYDGGNGEGLPADLLDFCKAGEPPVAFTLGTGMMHAARFFRAAVGACRILGARGLLLTKYPHQVPRGLPPSVRHCPFAPFLELLPHCAALVHHGGAGTVAKALATATPQLILPLAWDQPDNAARVKRLGAGDSLPARTRYSARLAKALARVMTPQTRSRCRAVAERFGQADPLAVAAGLVEGLTD
ncbi:MAG TPA: glycosyltransferase [Gemmataceae bacterium]|nr:glycosyltransferase [Gemmataceae bacterium]